MNRISIGNVSAVKIMASIIIGGALLAAPAAHSQQAAPDNTRANKGDSQKDAITADQQKMNPADRELTQKIRASIMSDKSLSTYAHNIKIVAQGGKVTLKGPVRMDKEKTELENKAIAVAGDSNVSSEITIAPPQS